MLEDPDGDKKVKYSRGKSNVCSSESEVLLRTAAACEPSVEYILQIQCYDRISLPIQPGLLNSAYLTPAACALLSNRQQDPPLNHYPARTIQTITQRRFLLRCGQLLLQIFAKLRTW